MADWVKSEQGYANLELAEYIFVERLGAVDYAIYAEFGGKQTVIKKFKTEKEAKRLLASLMDSRQSAKIK